MQDSGNRFPPARREVQMHFYTELNRYLGSEDAQGTTFDRIHPVFRNPAAAVREGVNHFTMNANLG